MSKEPTSGIAKLNEIQQALKVPKNRHNKFGGFKYRSAEDIIEAIKPLLGDLVLILDLSIVKIDDNHVYVEAVAKLMSETDTLSARGYAREPLARKGMDPSQITGAAMSYAKKYALGNLFLIDDGVDADCMNNNDVHQGPMGQPVDAGDFNREPTNDAREASEAIKQMINPEPPSQASAPVIPGHIDAPTKQQREILRALKDYYVTQLPPSHKFSPQKLSEQIINNFGHWPNHAKDAELIKQYVNAMDVSDK